MQDMGAAGIICSTSEMSSAGQCGMIINLDKVPVRQQMKPFEILLSESQEINLIDLKWAPPFLRNLPINPFGLICTQLYSILWG